MVQDSDGNNDGYGSGKLKFWQTGSSLHSFRRGKVYWFGRYNQDVGKMFTECRENIVYL